MINHISTVNLTIPFRRETRGVFTYAPETATETPRGRTCSAHGFIDFDMRRYRN